MLSFKAVSRIRNSLFQFQYKFEIYTIIFGNKIVILLLAAMNLSKDFHELKLQHSELKKAMDQKISSLIEKIDKEIEKTE